MKQICVLVSGSGSNLQRIIDATESGEIKNAEVNLVIADRDCYALERAANHGIRTLLIPRGKGFSAKLSEAVSTDTDLVVLAGFLSILNNEFCEKFKGKIINIHPALLPKFGGKGMWGNHVHEAVLKAGEKKSGATVHYVTSGIDEGEIILQKSFDITSNDSVENISAKVHEIEHEIFPKAIDQILNNTGKIAFITDLHMLEKNVEKKGIKTVQNWKTVLEDARNRGISSIVFGGDLGEKEALKILEEDIIGFYCQVILGNHDKIKHLDKFFPQAKGKEELFYTTIIAGADGIFLDTSSYKLSEEQQTFLQEWLTNANNPVIFIHHPVLGDGSWMDKEHPLKNREKVQEILKESGKNITLISGHYHHFHDETTGSIRQIIAPAVSYQILKQKDYKADKKSFGYLILDFTKPQLEVEQVLFSV